MGRDEVASCAMRVPGVHGGAGAEGTEEVMDCAHGFEHVVVTEAQERDLEFLKVLAPTFLCTRCGAVGHVRPDTALMVGKGCNMQAILPHVEWRGRDGGVLQKCPYSFCGKTVQIWRCGHMWFGECGHFGPVVDSDAVGPTWGEFRREDFPTIAPNQKL